MNIYELFMKFHEIFMIGTWLVHNDGSWTLFMNIFIKCSSWTNDEYLRTFIEIGWNSNIFMGNEQLWISWMLNLINMLAKNANN
jgi:hypothetical protein